MTETNTITKEMIARINELAHLSKTRQLSASELKEQAELRQQYVNAIKAQVTAQLDNITIVNPDGTTAKPQLKEVCEHIHAHEHDHEHKEGCAHHHDGDDGDCGCGDHDHCSSGCDCGCGDHHSATNGRAKNNGGYGKH